MQTDHYIAAMQRDLRENGFDAAQAERYDFAFAATKLAVVTLMAAKYGAESVEVIEALMDSRQLADEACLLVARMEVSPDFVGFIHSALRF